MCNFQMLIAKYVQQIWKNYLARIYQGPKLYFRLNARPEIQILDGSNVSRQAAGFLLPRRYQSSTARSGVHMCCSPNLKDSKNTIFNFLRFTFHKSD